MDNLINAKANSYEVYTISQVNNLLNLKANQLTTYTKIEVNNIFGNYNSIFIDSLLIDNYYTKTQTDVLVAPNHRTYTAVVEFSDIDTVGINTLSIIGSININIKTTNIFIFILKVKSRITNIR